MTDRVRNLPEPSCFHGNGMSRESGPPRWTFECKGSTQKVHSWPKNGSGRAVCNRYGMELTVAGTRDCFGEREET